MKTRWMTGAAGVMALSIAGVNAQTSGSQTPQTQTPQTQTAQQTDHSQHAATTLRGCVYKERDVPGRAPNMAERAGVMEDYILVPSHNMAGGSGMSGTASTTTGGTTGSTSGTATGSTTGSTASGTATSGTATTQTAAGTSGSMTGRTMHMAYKLEQIADERLRAVVGKMVEVTGRVDASATDTAASGTATGTATTTGSGTTGSGTGTTGSATGTTGGTTGAATTGTTPGRNRGMGPDSINLPEFEVTSLKEVEGTCPATPNIKK